MEKCATQYHSPTLKYAVNRFTEAHVGCASGLSGGIDRFLRQLVSAHDWSDDELAEQPPAPHSQEACDDTIGKKCVFRNGWDRDSSYLLLNYRDESATNEIYHKNLTLTIPVKAEKTHHGHSDENALCMLVAQERILLTEGGYRKGAERDCTYRSDYYHNKLIVRKGSTGRTLSLITSVTSANTIGCGQSAFIFIGLMKSTVRERAYTMRAMQLCVTESFTT